MTKLIAGLALLFLIGGGGTDARAAGSWCAFYDAFDIQLRLPQL